MVFVSFPHGLGEPQIHTSLEFFFPRTLEKIPGKRLSCSEHIQTPIQCFCLKTVPLNWAVCWWLQARNLLTYSLHLLVWSFSYFLNKLTAFLCLAQPLPPTSKATSYGQFSNPFKEPVIISTQVASWLSAPLTEDSVF